MISFIKYKYFYAHQSCGKACSILHMIFEPSRSSNKNLQVLNMLYKWCPINQILEKDELYDALPALLVSSLCSWNPAHIQLPESKRKFTWQGFAWIRFCSRASLVPPITTWTPIEGWYFNKVFASAAAWFASSLVGHITRTKIGGRFWSRLIGGDFVTTSIDGSWNNNST